MKTAGYDLTWITGIAAGSITYGSGLYGDGTYGDPEKTVHYGDGRYGQGRYGQIVTEPVIALRWESIPWRAGQPVEPSWRYRQGDTDLVFEARILADGDIADLTAVERVELYLYPCDGRPRDQSHLFDAHVVGQVMGLVRRVWQRDDLAVPGVYEPTIVLLFDTGRYVTVPCDSRHTFVIDDVYTATDYGFGKYGTGNYGQYTYGGLL